MMSRIVTALGLLAIAGCAAQRTAPELPPDHPANPAAAEVALPEPSQTLAIVDPVRAEPLPPSGHAHVGPGTEDPVTGPAEHTNHSAPASPQEVPIGAVPPGAQGALATAPAAGQPLYVCPMHPKVVATDPTARCPECKMKINEPLGKAAPSTVQPQPGAAGTAADDHGHHGTHGGDRQ